MKIRTIRRNTKERRVVFATATRCLRYSLGDYFIAKDCDVEHAEAAMDRFDAKLIQTGEGRYTVRVHSNLWYELLVPAQTATTERAER